MLEDPEGTPLLEQPESGTEHSGAQEGGSTPNVARRVGLLFCLALIVRAAAAPFLPEVLYYDAILFDFECIRAFAAGDFSGGYLHWVPPLFPAIVALFYKVIGDLEVAGRASSCVVGALTVIPVYGITRLYGGPRLGVLAALLLAVSPFHVLYSVRISSHIHYAFFYALLLWAAFALLRRPSVSRGILMAAAAGLAYWVRQEVVIFVALIVAAILALPLIGRWWRVATENPTGLGAVRIALTIALVFGGYVFPIVNATHEATGRWVMSSKGGVSLFGAGRFLTRLTPDRTRVEWETKISTMEDYQPLSITGTFLDDPAGFLGSWGSNVWTHLSKNMPRVFGYATIPFAILGLFLLRGVPRSGGLHLFGVATLGSAIGLLSLFYDSPRLLLAYLPLGLMWAAAGLLELTRMVPAISEKRWVMIVTLASGLLCLGIPLKYGFTLAPSPARLAGEWIRERHGAGRRVMDPTANVAFFADGVAEFTPAASLDDIVFFARARGVEFFAFVPDDIDRSHPDLVADFLEDGELDGLEHLYSTTNEPVDRRVHLFRVR